MKKIILILVCMLPVGCIRLNYNIAPEFHSQGSVTVDGRIDADDPRVTVTVDDVTMDWKELKALMEKKMSKLPKEPSHPMGNEPAQTAPPVSLTPHSADWAVMDVSAGMTHSVQVGAFRNFENAQHQVMHLIYKGYPAQLVEIKDSRDRIWYTVRIGDYPTVESARTRAHEFTRREKIQSVVRPVGSL
jgi:cell division protein FtsN